MSTSKQFQELLETYDSGSTTPILGANTQKFAQMLADSANSSTAPTSPTIESLRQGVTEMLRNHGLKYPANIQYEDYKELTIGKVNCYVLTCRTQAPAAVPTLVMFYGGGFCLNTLSAHLAFMAQIAAQLPCNIVVPDLPLAPEHKADDILQSEKTFLLDLLTNTIRYELSEEVLLLGWSSGSNAALSTALNIQKTSPVQFQKIKRLILLSPWIDLSLQVSRNCPYQAQQNNDSIAVNADVLEIMAKAYLPQTKNGTDPDYNPAYRAPTELKTLPPTTVITGGSEVLFGDAVFITDKLRRAGNQVELITLTGQTHNYVVFEALSHDGVSVPSLIAKIAGKQPYNTEVGKDGLGLTISYHNQNTI